MLRHFCATLVLMGVGFHAQAQDDHPPVVSIYALKGDAINFGSKSISDVQLNDPESAIQITFSVDEPTASAFGKLTYENVGMQIIFYVCGEEIIRPLIREPIFGGGMALSGLDWDRARKIADVLSGDSSCN
ncbi:MAG: hypothetical protein WBC93_01930 [Sulfitobacter sp.]